MAGDETMTFAATLYVRDPQEKRRSDRRRARAASTLRAGDALPLDVIVLDVSRHGFRCETDLVLAPGAEVVLGLDGSGSAAARVCWRKGREVGCEFLTPLTHMAFDRAFSGHVVVTGGFRSLPSPSVPAPAVEPAQKTDIRTRHALAMALALAGAAWSVPILLEMLIRTAS